MPKKLFDKTMHKIFGLDFLRALAIMSVVAGHFFMNTAFGTAKFNPLALEKNK